MNDFIAVKALDTVFSGKLVVPMVAMWNRLEGRPRRHDFDRALKAEVRDALWMLTKQWQMGEFKGDDAGSPITARLHMDRTRLTKYRPRGADPQPFDNEVPLEAKVERRPVPFVSGGQKMQLDIRAEMGRRWLKMTAGIEPGLRDKFIAAFGFDAPDPVSKDDAPICAHREGWQAVAALAGRAMDGYALYLHLRGGGHAHDGITLSDPGKAALIEDAEAAYLGWYERLFYQPSETQADAWQPAQLEYAFEVSAPRPAGTETHLMADEYYHGHLDWYNLDIAPGGQGLGDVTGAPDDATAQDSITSSFIPVPISFDGMPNTRWWRFEEGRTNFGDIDPDTTEINKLLVIEFALVYANDWFLLPLTVPAGTIATVRGLSVTNVFGERTWIDPAGQGTDQDWQRWSMYNLATRGVDEIPADKSLVMLPSTPKIHEGAPFEAVELVRDENANMVWGIETSIPLPDGSARAGRLAAGETRRYFTRLIDEAGPVPDPVAPLENDAGWRYRVMTDVPENWIPFIPVHIPGSNREIQLRRAALPRVIAGDPDSAVPVRPRTTLLRHNLGTSNPYDLHEEEVPRAGVQVTQSFQRTRWYGGEVFLWVGVRKTTGRGERSGGLAFDQLLRKG